MITESFSLASEPVITPGMIKGKGEKTADVCILTFSHVIFENALASLPCREIAVIKSCRGDMPVYALDRGGRRVAFYLAPVGSAMAANTAIEANWLTGADKFILFGSAGCLDKERAAGKIVVPTAAYRDEGMSYHYVPPADYIHIPGSEKTAEILASLHVPYVSGKTWTTDAFYRELRHQMKARKAEGCLTVEMEIAGVQSVCAFHGWGFYPFLLCGDVLDLPEWDIAGLHEANHHLDNFALALKIAEAV